MPEFNEANVNPNSIIINKTKYESERIVNIIPRGSRRLVAADFSLRFDLTQAKACGYHLQLPHIIIYSSTSC